MAITYNSLGALQPNKDFRAPLAWANTMIPSFKPLASSFTENKVGKEVNGFFQSTQLFTQCISMLYTEISVLCYYVRFSQIQSHLYYQCFSMVPLVKSETQPSACASPESPRRSLTSLTATHESSLSKLIAGSLTTINISHKFRSAEWRFLHVLSHVRFN